MSVLLQRGGLISRGPSLPPAATGYNARVMESTAFGNLVAWLKLDSSPPVDTLGNLAPGSVVGGVTFITDGLPDDGAVVADFNGTSGYLSFADDADLHLSECAIHLAVDIDSLPSAPGEFRHILSKEGSGLTDQDFILSLFNNSGTQELRAQFILSGAPQRVIFQGIAVGRYWITLNIGGGSALELYVRGILRQSNSSYTAGINTNTRNMLIGAANFGSGTVQFFDGRAAHVQIYNRRITQAEINHLSFPLFGGSSTFWTLPDLSGFADGDDSADGLFNGWGTQVEGSGGWATDYTKQTSGGAPAIRVRNPAGSNVAPEMKWRWPNVDTQKPVDIDIIFELMWPAGLERNAYNMGIHGYDDLDDVAGRWVVDGPAILIVPDPEPSPYIPKLYVYSANKTTQFGGGWMVNNNWPTGNNNRGSITIPADTFSEIKIEVRGGMEGGSWSGTPGASTFVPNSTPTGTIQLFIDDAPSSGLYEGIIWHQTTNRWWRHLNPLFWTRTAPTSDMFRWFRNWRIVDRS